jgi:hypothetical protein
VPPCKGDAAAGGGGRPLRCGVEAATSRISLSTRIIIRCNTFIAMECELTYLVMEAIGGEEGTAEGREGLLR